jgi:hypothetical protein
MKKILFPFLLCSSIVAVSTLVESCYYDKESDLYGTTTTITCDTSAAKFATVVSPIISASCATSGCHSTASQSAGVNLGTYTAIKTYITNSKASFIGSIKQTAGYSKMPQGAAKLSDCNIAKIETWINGGMLNN